MRRRQQRVWAISRLVAHCSLFPIVSVSFYRPRGALRVSAVNALSSPFNAKSTACNMRWIRVHSGLFSRRIINVDGRGNAAGTGDELQMLKQRRQIGQYEFIRFGKPRCATP
jgi:hypothetical protein